MALALGIIRPAPGLVGLQDGSLNVTRTGGDAWSVDAGGGGAAAAGVVQTCNKWDAKGRNPAMNVYIDIDTFRCSSATPPEAPSSNGGGSGEAGSSSSGGEEDDEHDGPSRCKLGHLIQHCLPQLAAQLGGYSQLALCRCTWVADEASGRPLPGSILTVGRQDPSHWRLLRQLVRVGWLAGFRWRPAGLPVPLLARNAT